MIFCLGFLGPSTYMSCLDILPSLTAHLRDEVLAA